MVREAVPLIRNVVLVAASAMLAGCIIVPIPTPEMGIPLLAKDEIKRVEKGVGRLTREEVVALFGEPQESYADDQVVLYTWNRAQGIYLVGTAAGSGDIRTGKSEHRICLKYSPAGVLERFEYLDSVFGRDAATNKLIREWVAELGGYPPDYPLLWEERGRFPEIDHVTLNPGPGGPAIPGVTTQQRFVGILGRPNLAFGNEHWLLYASSKASYFEPVMGTKFEISDYDAGAYPYRGHYYALLVEFDSNSVFQDARVVEWSVATGPYQLSPLVADAFGVLAEELLFVRPFDWRFGETRDGGVYVATPGFIGAAAWKRDHYELSWKYPYSDIESVSYEQYRSGTFWLERGVRILVKPRHAEVIEIEPFEESFDAEFHVVNEFENLASKFILNNGT